MSRLIIRLVVALLVSWVICILESTAAELGVKAGVSLMSRNVEFGVPWSDTTSLHAKIIALEEKTGLGVWYENIDTGSDSVSPDSDNFGDQKNYGVEWCRITKNGKFAFDVTYSKRSVEEPMSIAKGLFRINMGLKQFGVSAKVKLVDSEKWDLWLQSRFESFDPVENNSNRWNPLPYEYYEPYAVPELKKWNRVSAGLSGKYVLRNGLSASGSLEYGQTGEFYGLIDSSSAVQMTVEFPWQLTKYVSFAPEARGSYLFSDAKGYLPKKNGYVGLKVAFYFSPSLRK